MNLPIECKARIKEHIGIVEQHLGELAPDEKSEILQALETHIYDALEARSGSKPTLELIEAIIAEMDPPESYGSAPLITRSHRPSLSPTRKIIFLSSIGILTLLFIAIWLADPFSSNWMPSGRIEIASDSTSSLVGNWISVDFVSTKEQFNPNVQWFQGDFYIKEITLNKDGSTDQPWWSWENNILYHSGDQSEGQLEVRTIEGEDYLFMEWMSGDVLIHKQKPRYYVLKRD